MELSTQIFKAGSRGWHMVSCSFDIEYLKGLFQILQEINKDGARIQIATIKESSSSQEDLKKAEDQVKDAYKIVIFIMGSRGEFISSESDSILDEKHLSGSVTGIIFDNAFAFQSKYNRVPENAFKIEFDFEKPPILEFTNRPADSTSNKSNLSIYGMNETWVNGVYDKVKSSIKNRSTSWGWLHYRNIYDLFLWFFIVPFAFFNINRLESYLAEYIGSANTVLQVAFFVYIFVLILFLFRILFNYARWLFPYLELKASSNRRAKGHRLFLYAISTTIVGTLIYDFIQLIF